MAIPTPQGTHTVPKATRQASDWKEKISQAPVRSTKALHNSYVNTNSEGKARPTPSPETTAGRGGHGRRREQPLGAATPRRHPHGLTNATEQPIPYARCLGSGHARDKPRTGRPAENWRDNPGTTGVALGQPRGDAPGRTRRSFPGRRRRPRPPPPLTTARTSAAMGPRRRFRRRGQAGAAPSALLTAHARAWSGAVAVGGRGAAPRGVGGRAARRGAGRAGGRLRRPGAAGLWGGSGRKEGRVPALGRGLVGKGKRWQVFARSSLSVLSSGRPDPEGGWWLCFHSAAWQQSEQCESSDSFVRLRLIWPFWLPQAGDSICVHLCRCQHRDFTEVIPGEHGRALHASVPIGPGASTLLPGAIPPAPGAYSLLLASAGTSFHEAAEQQPDGLKWAGLFCQVSLNLDHIHITSQMWVLVHGRLVQMWARAAGEESKAALFSRSAGLEGLGNYNILLISFPAYLLGCQLLKRAVAAALMALKLHSSP